MTYHLHVHPEIFQHHPEYVVIVVYAGHLTNRESDAESSAALREAEAFQREWFGNAKASSHPHVAAWREAFSRFGAKPSRYPCSVEALLSRVLKGQEIPAINAIVDHYNAVSIRHVLPVGGEDRDQLASDLWLMHATGTEPFDPIGGSSEGDGVSEVSYPEAREVVWADSAGVTCRRWNWRQGMRTRLTAGTREAYFVLDRLAPYPLEDLRAARDDLVSSILAVSPEATISVEEIDRESAHHGLESASKGERP